MWRFLFGMYPCSSTPLERSLLLEEMSTRYYVMKRKWQRLLPGAVRLRLNGTDGNPRSEHYDSLQLAVSGFHSPSNIFLQYDSLSIVVLYKIEVNPLKINLILSLPFHSAELVTAVQYFEQRQQREKEIQQHKYKSKEVRERISFLKLQAQVKQTSPLSSNLKLCYNL